MQQQQSLSASKYFLRFARAHLLDKCLFYLGPFECSKHSDPKHTFNQETFLFDSSLSWKGLLMSIRESRIASGFAQAGLLANMAQRREIWILKEFLAENDRLFSCAFGGEAPECTDLIVAIFSPRRRYAPLRVAYLRQNLLTWDGWVIWIQTDGKSEFRRMENAVSKTFRVSISLKQSIKIEFSVKQGKIIF